MDTASLSTYIAQPAIHRRVLKQYRGAYSLGVTRIDGKDDQAALSLRVANAHASDFPKNIKIGDEVVPILVDDNWTAPSPQ